MRKRNFSFWGFVGPILLAYIVVQLIPLVIGIYYSFTDWNGINSDVKLIGIQNYVDVFKDPTFKQSFWFTFKFTVLSIIVLNALGFGLALLVTRESKICNILRTVFFMPNLIGGLILGFIWQFIFTQVFSGIGKVFGQQWLLGWLSDGKTGLYGLVILMAWQMAGYLMVIYIASLQNIPAELLEAAEIDGANLWQKVKNIIIPLVRPAFTVSVFLTLANSFKLYDQNLSLTAGGPAKATEMLAMNIFNTAFQFNLMGIAQAKAVIFFVIVGGVSLIQLYFSKRSEVEM
ncbi:carbohydrate ABC transporter permease [Clostridium sp. 'White wine YQ']|uniref:carbohydrate ABC transporter permease n=1 Tax=Clostridium sp. 'White wine YQ' TaxID=3027474 RepID=UPI0023656123|nr:sugar ABC transporter permease [Clostridium sp. 'White wine YQ']MDD7793200.1 sugar ABC transporter permease [Clostridium sp. 'White wine YQ']